MCHKSISALDLLRRPTWILASLTLFAPGALAWNCLTCDPWGTCSDGSWTITQDVWGGATNWQQCLYCDSHSHWQIVANLKGQAWVGSYPHASYPVGRALNDVLNGPAPLLAAWNASYPTDHKFDFAYDLWLNGTTYEVMIWLNWNQTGPVGGNPFTNATIGGIAYNVYEGAGGSGPHCISFLPRNGMMDTATNFNLCSILSWISNLKWSAGPGGYYWRNPGFDSVQLGWEICDTYRSSKTYTMNFFDVYYGKPVSTPPTRTVNGTPRLASGHPCTLWDNQNVADYRASFTTNPGLKAAFEELQTWGNKRVVEPLNVPAHQLEADGTWSFPAFKRGYQDSSGKWNWEWDFNTTLQQRTEDVSNLGELYALTGDKKYGACARQILLALADAYGHGKGSPIPDPHGYDHFEAYGFDGGDTGMFLAKACHGYDLIYNLPTLSAEDRTHIERDLIRPLAEHLKKFTFMYTNHGRWGMVSLYGLFIAGVTLNDQPLLDLALYGPGGSQDKVTGGFMDCFNAACLRDGVVWGADTKIEEQMAAVSVLTTVAEVMWHHGVDLYGYQDTALKKSYDAALEWAGNGEVSKLLALPGIDAYQYVFRRYRDPRYLPAVGQLKPGFRLAIGEHLPTLPSAAATE